MDKPQPIASESQHWYDKQGNPIYEVPYADPRKGMRTTTLTDARKLDLVPSVTLIIKCAAAPGLEAWKATQLLQAALTLPRLEGETIDDYARRVIEDSKAQGEKARQRGTDLHEAIERYIQGLPYDEKWKAHIETLVPTLTQYGVNLFQGKAEHSFASPLGYGGKLDWHNDEVLLDFKTKDSLNGKKQLGYPEHIWQLAAYNQGMGGSPRRLINVFIGIDDLAVRVHEWTEDDAKQGLACFIDLLSFWRHKNNFGK